MATYRIGSDGDYASWAALLVGETLVADDIIQFARGETFSFSTSIDPGANDLTFEAYGTGAKPRLVDGGLDSSSSLFGIATETGITIQYLYLQRDTGDASRGCVDIRANDGTIQFCEIVGGQNGGIRVVGNPTGLSIRHNEIHDNGDDGIWGQFGDNTLIEWNTFYNNSSNGTGGDGIQSSVSTGTQIFRHNTITMQAESIKQGIVGGSSGNTIIYDNVIALAAEAAGIGQVGINIDGSCEIYRNKITGTGKNGIYLLLDGNSQTQKVHSNIIDISGAEYGIYTTGSATYGAASLSFANNTIRGAFTQGIRIVNITSGNAAVNNNIIDCLDAANTTFGIKGTTDITFDAADKNLIINLGSGSASSDVTLTNTITDDPQLDANYRPGNSALKAAGTWIAGVRGYDDLPLPIHPDIGAVQDRDYPGRKQGATDGDADE